MPLYKSAQLFDQNFLDEPESEVILYKHPNEEDMVEVEQELEPEFNFDLPPLPGFELVVEEDREPVVEEKREEKSKPKDMWDRNGHPDVLVWAQGVCRQIPMSNGKSGGLEREIACYKKLRSELSRGMSEDLYGKINADQFEVAVERIDERIEKLEEILEKLTGRGKKKKAEEEDGLVKEARTSPFHGWVMVVSPLLMRCAQVCISGTVSSGKDISKLFSDQVDKYGLNKRERAELLQVLDNMGYPLIGDRFNFDDEPVIVNSPAGELNSQYYA